MSEITDIKLAKDGDAEAFARLVGKYQKRLMLIAYQHTDCVHDADDIVQETFIQAFRSLKSLDKESSFSLWLYRICLNKCKEFMRKTGKMRELQELFVVEKAEWIETWHHNPELVLLQKERLRLAKRAIDSLKNADQKKVLMLQMAKGLSTDEISEKLEKKGATVRSLLHRGIAKAKKFVKEQEI